MKQKLYKVQIALITKKGEYFANESSLNVIAGDVHEAMDKVGDEILETEKAWKKDKGQCVIESVSILEYIDKI